MAAKAIDVQEFEQGLNEVTTHAGGSFTREHSGFYYQVTMNNHNYLVQAKVRRIGQQPDEKKESSTATIKNDALKELESLAEMYGSVPALGYRVIDEYYGINDFVLITLDNHENHQRGRSVLSRTGTGRVYNGKQFSKLNLIKNDLIAAVRYDHQQYTKGNLVVKQRIV